MKLPWPSPRYAQAPLVPPSTWSPFLGPSHGLFLSTSSINGKVVRVLFDDESLRTYLSWRHERSLCVNTTMIIFAADMPAGRYHGLDATDALDVGIGGYQERLVFAVF